MLTAAEELRRQRAGYLLEAQRAKNEAGGGALTINQRERINTALSKINEIDLQLYSEGNETDEILERQRSHRPGAEARTSSGSEFRSLGEFLTEVVHAGSPNRQADPRLFQQTRAASGLSENIGSDGGFAVGGDHSMELLTAARQTSKLAGRCRQFPISNNSNRVVLPACDETSRATGSRWGGIRTYWQDEAESATASKPKFRKLELSLKKLTGLVYLTDELLQDAAALDSFVRDAFASEFGFQLDDALLRGTGAGQPLGVYNSSALVTISKETSQIAGTLVAENLEKAYARLPANSVATAAWYINMDVWPQLFKLQHVVRNVAGTENVGGAPVFVPPNGLSSKPFGTILGLPIVPLEQCETLGTKGDVLLADFGEYILADKGGIQTASSIHVRFAYDEQILRFILRVDGQPIRSVPLTPYKGTASQSPFIVVETRS